MLDSLYPTISKVAAGMLLLSLLPMPYGYYQLLRLAITAAALIGAFRAYQLTQQGWAIGLGVVALLFNPVFPVYLSRGMWAVVDVIVGIAFWVSGSKLSNR